ALVDEGAPVAEAFKFRHRYLPPRAVAHPLGEVVTVARLRFFGELPQAQDLRAEARGRRVMVLSIFAADSLHLEQGILGEPAGDLVFADVVVPPLQERDLGRLASLLPDHFRGQGRVDADDLALEGQGRRRDDGPLPRTRRVE